MKIVSSYSALSTTNQNAYFALEYFRNVQTEKRLLFEIFIYRLVLDIFTNFWVRIWPIYGNIAFYERYIIFIRVNSNSHEKVHLFERLQKIEFYREKCLVELEKWPSASQVQILITIPPLINLIESLTKSWLQSETKWNSTDGIVSIKDVLKYLVTIDLKEKEC